jgi:hypothetical protein
MVPAEQFIVCSHCGTKNRLPSLRTGRPRCGRCGKPLASAVVQSTSTASGAAPSRATHGGKVGWLTGIAALLVFGAGGVLLLKPFGEGVSGGTGGPPTVGLQSPAIDDWVTPPPELWRKAPAAPVAQDVLRAEQQTPGAIYNHTGREPLAPLTLVTAPGADYYVKLVDPQTKTDLFGIYVHGGKSLDAHVPLGGYEVRYAAGQTWYGIAHRFGQDTAYFRADPLFSFTATNDGYSGYTIELILQSNGNLHTTQIGAAEF